MVRGRSTPVIFGGHFHVTRFGMFRSRAGLALNPWSTAASPRTAYRHRPYLHTQGVIRTAPPSRSRVKNDYSLLGMLSRGKFSLSPFFFVTPTKVGVQLGRPRHEAGSEAFAGMTMRVSGSDPEGGHPSSGSMLKRISPPSPTRGRRKTRKRLARLRPSPSVAGPALPVFANGR